MVSLGLDSVRGHVVSEGGMGVMAVNQWRVLEGRLPRSVWGVVHACMHAWQESQDSRMPVHHSNRLIFFPAQSSSVHRAGIAFDQ